jgi:CheY-like chemotaxis protein
VKILLIEDSKIIRRENESALQKAGYEVISAEDGESAIQLARAQKPDLILLDMILPKMSGPQVLQYLKIDPATTEIPVVIVSSLSEMNRQKLMDMGAEDYLEKGALMPSRGINLLPQRLENIVSRIIHKRNPVS